MTHDVVARHEFDAVYVKSCDNVADGLSKTLKMDLSRRFMEQAGMRDMFAADVN